MTNDEKQARQSKRLLHTIEPNELSVEIKPVALNLQHSIVTTWELSIFFNHRTHTVTQLTNNELREVHNVIKEALANIENPEFISATLNFEREETKEERE